MAKDVSNNWKFLFEKMTTIVTALNSIDVATEMTPRLKLNPVRENVAQVMNRVKSGNLSRIGKHFIARDVAFVLNSLNSVDSALQTQSITRARVGEIISAASKKIDALRTEIGVQVDQRVLAHQANEYKRRAEAGTVEKKKVADLEADVKNSASFSDFSTAMKSLLGAVEEIEAHDPEALNEGRSPVEAAAMSEVRERHLFQAIGGEYDEEIRVIRAKLAQFHPSEDALFTFLRMPIVVISSKQIPTRNLDAAGIKYRVVPFAGIQFGTSPGGRREQSDTHGVIFSDQIVAAIPNRLPDGAKEKPTTSKRAPVGLPSAPMTTMRTRGGTGQKVQSSQGFGGIDLGLTRAQLPAILKMRLGRDFVDVLGTAGTRTSFLVSRQLPGFKFIWLLPQNQYRHIGGLNMREVGLPFRAPGQK